MLKEQITLRNDVIEEYRREKKELIDTIRVLSKRAMLTIISVVFLLCLVACFFIYCYFYSNYNIPNQVTNSNNDTSIVQGNNNSLNNNSKKESER